MEKTVISLPFTLGEDTRTDKLLSSKPSRVENRLVRGGTLQRRPSANALASAIDTGGTQSSGEALFTFKNELVRINGGTTYGLAPTASEWVTKVGPSSYSTLSKQRIVRNTHTQVSADCATVNGVTVYVWVEQSSPNQGLHVAVFDESSGTVYQSGASAMVNSTNAYQPRCVVVGSNVVILFADQTNGKIWSSYVSSAAPETAPVPLNIKLDMWTGSPGFSNPGRFDACAYKQSFASAPVGVAAYAAGASGTDINAFFFGSTGAVINSHTFAAQAGTNGLAMLSVQSDTAGTLYFIWGDASVNAGTGFTYFLTANSLWTTITAKTQVSNANWYAAQQGAVESPTNNVTVIFYPVTSASPGLWWAQLAANGQVSSATVVPGTTLQTTMVSEPVPYNGSTALAIATNIGSASNNTQPTVWVVDTSGNPLARCLSGLAGIGTFGSLPPRLTRPFAVGTTTYFLCYERGRLAFSSNLYGQPTDVTPVGLTRLGLTPVKANAVSQVTVGDSVYIGGACPRTYDGKQVVETGFHIPPLAPSIGASAAGSLSAGTYSLRCIVSWVNAQGELVRSAVSPALTWTASASSNQTVALSVFPMDGRGANIFNATGSGTSTTQFEVYRTEANGSIFYRDSSASTVVTLLNAVSGASLNYTTTQSDANLISGEILYTTGGGFDWLPPPAYVASCEHKGRLIVLPSEDPYTWAYSNVNVKGESLRFNDSWVNRVPNDTGPLVAVSSMDGNLILWATGGAYVVQGDGPDNLGNNPWPAPQRLTSVDAGPTSWQSVFSTPNGILVQTVRGWKLLDRALGFQYLGADVEAYGQLTPRVATVRPDTEELWIQADTGSDVPGQQTGTLVPSDGGYVLVYNYRYSQWTVLTNYGAQDACFYQGKYTRVRGDGVVYQEAPSSYDNAPSVIETPWLKVAGLQGFQRIWRALLVGTFGSDFTLTWDVAYDYNPAYNAADTVTFSSNGAFTPGQAWQLRRHMRIQKCEAVKFRFTETPTVAGPGMGLTDLTLECGVKRGAYKLPAAQSI